MNVLFQGSSLDVYTHWLILSLGIGVLVFGVAIFTSCRSFANISGLNNSRNTLIRRIYRAHSRFHSYYWAIFGFALILHMMVASVHLGLPATGEPYVFEQRVSFYTAIGNIVSMMVMFSSCRSFISAFSFFTSGNPFNNNVYKHFFKSHSYFWIPLAISIAGHIVFGMIHAINT
jgi:hypothetical protein